MPSALDRKRAIVWKLLSVGAARDGVLPQGIDESRLVSAIAGQTQSQFDPADLRQELQTLTSGSGPVERVGSSDRYRLTTTAAGKQLRNRLNQQADDDNWWKRGTNGDD